MPKITPLFPTPSAAAVTLAAAYGALFVTMGVHLPFFPLWLADRGLTPAEIALVLALPLIQRIVTLPLVTSLADRMPQLKWAVLLYAGASGAVTALYLVVDGFWGIAAVTVGSALFFMGLVPVLDALTAALAREGLDYGRVRLWGSITFMIAAAAGGIAIQRIGVGIIVPVMVISLGVLTLIALVLPTDVARRPGGKRSLKEGWSLLLGAPGVLLVLGGISLIQTSHAFYYAFGSLHFKVLGIGEGTIGLLWAASVVAEIVFFAISGFLVARFGLGALLMAAAGAALVRWTAMAVDPGVAVTLLAQILHALTFAACHVCGVTLMARTVPPHYAATAQGAFFALHGGVNGAMMLATGPIYSAFAGQGYLVMLIVSGAGLACLLVGLPRLTQPQSKASGG